MQKFRKTVSLSYVMAEDPDMGTRIIVLCGLRIEKSLLTEMIRSDTDCQETCPAESFGGKDSVKGNRQGFLSRQITRRSGRIAK